MKYNCKYDKLVKPSEIEDHPYNPNTHSDKQIKKLADYLKKTGWRHPVIVSKYSGFIVAGHGRKSASILARCDIPVVYQDFKDEAEERAFLLADNKLAELSELDSDMLDMNFDFLKDSDFDIEDLGFDLSELNIDDYEDKNNDQVEYSPKDLSGQTEINYRVEIICNNENEQELLYEKLNNEGYKCRILTL